jgi:predicted Zn-dependent protease with MMP-like domain
VPAPAEIALDHFEALAARLWRRIPEELKEGVEALVIEEKELGHPTLGGVYTLGECVTESWPSGYGDDMRSELVLYYGSFLSLSFEEDAFEWEEEIWETITHELLHHREAAAGESALDDMDWATDQNFLRLAGRPFDPAFYRAIPADSDGIVRLDSETFAEGAIEGDSSTAIFTWRGRGFGVRVPAATATLFVSVRNLAGGRLTVIVPSRASLLRRILGRGADGFQVLSRRALPVPRS